MKKVLRHWLSRIRPQVTSMEMIPLPVAIFSNTVTWSTQPKTPITVEPFSEREYWRQHIERVTVRETEGLGSWYRAQELWN